MMPFKMNRNMFVIIIGAAILLGAMHFVSIYFSDHYKVAKSFIEQNEELVKSIGPLKRTSLAFLDGAQSRGSGGVASESYSFNVVGEKASGKVRVVVESKDSLGWQVVDAKLSLEDGVSIQLLPKPQS